MPDSPKPTVEDLGHDFEIIEDSSAKPASPSQRPAAAPSGSPKAPAPLRSVGNWSSLGLALGLAGLLGSWDAVGVNFVHGALLALVSWALLRNGLATVQPTYSKLHPAIPAALAVYGLVRVAAALMSMDLADLLGWSPASGAGDVLGAWLALAGGALAFFAKNLGGKADAKLPPAPPERPVDKQFAGSLLAYLMCLVGMLAPWSIDFGTAGLLSPAGLQSGADSLFGTLTMACVVLALWASWVGMWKLWGMPIVTGKLGLILFLAPIEAMVLGLAGLSLQLAQPPEFIASAWPGVVPTSMVGGPILTLAGAALALYLLLTGAKQAVAMGREQKAQAAAERKAARDSRKSGEDHGKK